MGVLALLVVLSMLLGGVVGAALVRPHKDPAAAVAASPQAPAQSTPTTPSSPSAPSNPSSPSTPATGSSPDEVAAAVDQAVVDINTTLNGGRGAGTGMILTSDGIVLTNNHVIAGAESISVQIAGTGPTYDATVLGYDVTDDVAVLQLDGAKNLATVTPASGVPAVGSTVIAVGNALGASGPHSVTSGTVVALDRTISVNDDHGGIETLHGLIETDAELQPGDSGGPLLDSSGKVVGMDTAASASGIQFGSGGQGFAIPIATALDIAHQITTKKPSGDVHIGPHAILGIQLGNESTDVAGVQPGGPADEAGIDAGSSITSIDGKAVSSSDELRALLDRHAVGDRVKVEWTDSSGDSQQATITLVEGPPA